MLTNLYIENIAVIEKTNIEFSRGLNVLTGETGAGKSIVIDAISAVLGRRTSRELVRTGAQSAFVSATFSEIGDTALRMLTDLGYTTEDGQLIIEREFTLSGKNNCRINGRPAPVSALREVGRFLINIHGQHESYELMSPDLHIGYIDALGGHQSELDKYRAEFAHYKELSRILSQKDSDDRERARRADLLSFQIEELESADLQIGEAEALTEERNILANSQRLRELLSSANFYLSGDGGELPGALSLLSDSSDTVSAASQLMPSVETTSERIQNAYYELQDIASDISSALESIEDDPQRLEEIELRLDLISKLQKKYGDTAEEILRYLEDIRAELDAINRFAEDREQLLLEQQESFALCTSLATDLSEKRRTVAERFSQQVALEMRNLDMPSAKIEVSQLNCPLCENGIDVVEFLVSTNAGEPPKPVAKVASGGELSRMMLAIKNVLSRSDPTDTLIFDEVDSGISGSAARRVGDALKRVSTQCQSLCVTHLPQIAALADSHYLIKKSEHEGRTFTKVTPLTFEGRVEELARIIGGVEIGDAAYDYARELLSENTNNN
ncbi:MAG: DNA repair protein RecN [Clostridia bacterium]|nr:DNA repair protein RecN [Clostridia bacterium]